MVDGYGGDGSEFVEEFAEGFVGEVVREVGDLSEKEGGEEWVSMYGMVRERERRGGQGDERVEERREERKARAHKDAMLRQLLDRF